MFIVDREKLKALMSSEIYSFPIPEPYVNGSFYVEEALKPVKDLMMEQHQYIQRAMREHTEQVIKHMLSQMMNSLIDHLYTQGDLEQDLGLTSKT